MPPLSQDKKTGHNAVADLTISTPPLSHHLPIALTMGDPAGIGPEITQAAWQNLRAHHQDNTAPSPTFFVIGDPKFYPNAQIIKTPDQARAVFAHALPVLPIKCADVQSGTPNAKAAPAILRSIDMAVEHALMGTASAVVTNPIAKHVLYEAGFTHPGHTEYLGALTRFAPTPYPRGPLMMLSAQDLRVALVTIHMPLRDVASNITPQKIIECAEILHGALQCDLGIANPRIAVCGLNPHAGENGALGREEIEIIAPAVKTLRRSGINITDPQSADTLFHAEARTNYDAALCMYHDQGLIPVKTLDFHGGVNTSLGLPIVRTSPDHGTAFAIAGTGQARADSLIAALHLAANIADHRAQHLMQI